VKTVVLMSWSKVLVKDTKSGEPATGRPKVATWAAVVVAAAAGWASRNAVARASPAAGRAPSDRGASHPLLLTFGSNPNRRPG
jgi:hypothetical protein